MEYCRRADEAGFVLPAVLLALVAILILAGGGFEMARQERAAAQAFEGSMRAYWAASAGLAAIVSDAPSIPPGSRRTYGDGTWRAEVEWTPLARVDGEYVLTLVSSTGSWPLPPGRARRTLQEVMLRGSTGEQTPRPGSRREVFSAY
ncbi:MAG: hypothetical protein ABFS14_06065 [Gemmatimonadota bacterium]